METDDPLLLEALREVDRIAPAAPDVAPPLEEPPRLAGHFDWPGYPETGPPAPRCLLSDLVDEVDCPHCMEQRGRHIDAMIARSRGWQ